MWSVLLSLKFQANTYSFERVVTFFVGYYFSSGHRVQQHLQHNHIIIVNSTIKCSMPTSSITLITKHHQNRFHRNNHCHGNRHGHPPSPTLSATIVLMIIVVHILITVLVTLGDPVTDYSATGSTSSSSSPPPPPPLLL